MIGSTRIAKSETKKTWKNLAQKIGGKFIDGGVFNKDKVELKYLNSIITLDICERANGNRYVPCVRIRCPFVSVNEFEFNITIENDLTHIGKIFGIKDIMINNSLFDDVFYLKSRTKDKLFDFLNSEIIQQEYLEFAKNDILGLEIKISDDKPHFSLQTRPQKVFWIYLEKKQTEANIDTLKSYFNLCKITLDRLIEIGEAEDVSPNIQ